MSNMTKDKISKDVSRDKLFAARVRKNGGWSGGDKLYIEQAAQKTGTNFEDLLRRLELAAKHGSLSDAEEKFNEVGVKADAEDLFAELQLVAIAPEMVETFRG